MMSELSNQRIISLVPSITELLYDLGLGNQVVGITKFCVHPQEWFRSKTRIGGTKQINIETIKSMHPTLVIASKEENIKEQVEQLADLLAGCQCCTRPPFDRRQGGGQGSTPHQLRERESQRLYPCTAATGLR